MSGIIDSIISGSGSSSGISLCVPIFGLAFLAFFFGVLSYGIWNLDDEIRPRNWILGIIFSLLSACFLIPCCAFGFLAVDCINGVISQYRHDHRDIGYVQNSITFYNRSKWIGAGAQFIGGSLLLVSDGYGVQSGSLALGGFALEKFSEWKKESLQDIEKFLLPLQRQNLEIPLESSATITEEVIHFHSE